MAVSKILKYEIPNDRPLKFTIEAAEFKPLCVQMQRGVPCLWAMVTEHPLEVTSLVGPLMSLGVVVTVLVTGARYRDLVERIGDYVGTFQDGGFVGHVFVRVLK